MSPNDTGQVLIYPFYSVHQTMGTTSGMDTLVVISNDRPEAKAIRLTIREGTLGHQVFQVNMYLGPLDSFSFALTDSPVLGEFSRPTGLIDLSDGHRRKPPTLSHMASKSFC